MVVGEAGDTVYIASEESAMRAVEDSFDRVWSPRGGEAVIVRLREG
jgi:glutamate synthase domain-containing protein 1